MAVIGIDYNEGNKKKNLEYKAVTLSYNWGEDKKIFDSGDFVKDWYDCMKFVIFSETGEPVSHSSSVDHFIMDGAPFHSVYMIMMGDKPSLFSYNTLLQMEREEDGIEFFLPYGVECTWAELRDMVGDPVKPENREALELEPETPIAKVRNSLTPIVNYFFMLGEIEKKSPHSKELRKLLKQELKVIQTSSLPRLLELIKNDSNWKS